MSVTTLIEFDDVTEHTFDASLLTLLNDKGQLKNLVSADEVIFSNFDTDNLLLSKRGNKNLVLSGVNNTGQVNGGVLKFTVSDKSIATYPAITTIIDDFGFRCKISVNVLNVVSNTDLLSITSNVDGSKIIFYLQNQGGGVTRIRRQVINSSGSNVSDAILTTMNFSVDTQFELLFINDDNGVTTSKAKNAAGEFTALFTSPALNFTDCDIIFGDDLKSTSNYDDFQLFNSILIPDEAFPYAEPVSYGTSNPSMLTNFPFLLDEITLFSPIIEELSGDNIKHFIVINLNQVYHDGTNWVTSDGTLAQANTEAEIQTNLSTLPIVKGIGAFVQIGHVFSTILGYSTPLIESISLKYTFEFKPDTVTTSLVFGTVLDNTGMPVSGAIVRVTSEDKFFNNAFIGPNAKAITNAQGKFSMSIVETQTSNTFVDFTIEYTEKQLVDGVETDVLIIFEYTTRIIPNFPTAQFATLQQPV